MNDDCPLCHIDREAALTFFSSESAVAQLSGERAVRGHAVLVSTRHVEHVADLDDADHREFFDAYRRVERALLDATGAARVVCVKLGLVVPHLHFHLYPIAGDATRDDVVAMVERRVRDGCTDEELGALARELRDRLAVGRG